MEEFEIEWIHLREVLEAFAQHFRNKLQENMLKNGSNASGNLVNSIKTEVKIGVDTYEVGVWLADYWYYVNNGRGPSKNGGNGTLRDKIREWIKVKKIVPHIGTIKTGKQAGKKYLPTIEQLSFLIARKIHREGYVGTHFFDDAKADSTEYFQQSINYAISEDIENWVMSQTSRLKSIIE